MSVSRTCASGLSYYMVVLTLFDNFCILVVSDVFLGTLDTKSVMEYIFMLENQKHWFRQTFSFIKFNYQITGPCSMSNGIWFTFNRFITTKQLSFTQFLELKYSIQ